MRAHEVMRAVIKSLGAKHLAGILRKCPAQVYRYAVPPNDNPDTPWSPSIISRLDEVVEDLMNFGDVTTARMVAGRWAHLVGCSLVENTPVRPDRGTIAEEGLDDHEVLVRFHQAANDMESDFQTVCELAEAVKREIDQTREKRLELEKVKVF